MAQDNLLTIDFGTSGIKCIIFTSTGKRVIKRYTPIQYYDSEGLSGIGKEFDATGAWITITKMIRDCLRDEKVLPETIKAVAATSQRHGAVFLGEKGKIIYSGPNLDARGVFVQDSVIEELKTSCPPTGCWPPLLYSLCRLIWFKRLKPDLFAQIQHVLSINDWIVYQLTGEVTTDPSQASNTQFMDIQKSVWSQEILEMAEVPAELLPPIRNPGSVVGNVTTNASKVTGLSTKTIVGIGGGDTQCALLGSAILEPSKVCIVAGNTAPIQLITDTPIIDEACKLWTGRYLLPNRWILEANTGTTGEILRWFIQNLVQPLSPNLKDPQAAYMLVEQLAKQTEVGSTDAMAILGPQIMDASNMTTLRPSMFIFPSLTLPAITPITINDLARALFENICYAMRSNLELIQERAKVKFDHCTVAGGLIRSQLWQQMLADVTGLEIYRGSEVEASSLGAAICAATAAGLYDSLFNSAQKMVNLLPSLKPNSENQRKYETYFFRWQILYKQSANL